MTSKQINERSYFTTILAALLVLAMAIGVFVYNVLKTEPEDMEYLLEDINGNMYVSPRINEPSGPPFVPVPSEPPPGS